LNSDPSEPAADPGTALQHLEIGLESLKSDFPNWRDAYTDWTTRAPAFAVLSPPSPYFVWAVESGELDTDLGGADDPADQVYFAVRDGLIKIGWSGSPRSRLSSASTLTRTVFGGSLQEAMLHNIFDGSREWQADKPEGSSAEWYRPTPLLVRLANAEAALAREAGHRLFAQFWHERYPDGCRIEIIGE
jgi:hypothetical protein